MHHAFMLALRTVVGAVALIAFYVASFLYEDEERQWQNRLEEVWMSIHDRARVTESTSAALLSRVGQITTKSLNWFFGSDLISFRSIAMSIIASVNVPLIIAIVYALVTAPRADHDDKFVNVLILPAVSLVIFAAPIVFRRIWIAALCALLSLTMVVALSFPFAWGGGINDILGGDSLGIVVSVLSDILGVVVIRWLFSRVATTLALNKIIYSVILCIVLVIIIEAVPILIERKLPYIQALGLSSLELRYILATALNVTMFMNLWTAIYCLFPVPILIILLLHKGLWPTLSRAIYPLTRYTIFTNRKLLISIGFACGTFAIGHGIILERIHKFLANR
jgi:hypothetical protein